MDEYTLSVLHSIDLQLEELGDLNDGDYNGDNNDDHAHAIALQRAMLLETKREIMQTRHVSPPTTSQASSKSRNRQLKHEPEDDQIVSSDDSQKPGTELSECAVCGDKSPTEDMFDVECCGSTYHEKCFQDWFDAWLNSRQLLKCCGEAFDPDSLRDMLPESSCQRYKKLKREMEADHKLYCSNAHCAAFLDVRKQ